MAPTSAKRWLALIGISVLSFVGFIDFTIVNTILPGIQRDLRASIGELQWVMNGFALMLTIFMVTMGRIGDIYGRRRVLYIGVIVFAAASLLAGIAESMAFLIACRIAQGISAAVTFTCAPSLVAHHFPKEEQGKAMGIFMSVTGLGLALGPVLGGLFMTWLTWRWAFYVNIPVVIVGFLIAWRTVEEAPRQADETVDWLGLSLWLPGLAAFLTALMQGNDWGWLSPGILALFAIGIACLIGFVRAEGRARSPIVDFALLKQPLYLACIIAALTLGAFNVVGNFLPPLYLLNIRNEAPYVAGLMLLPISGLVALVPSLIGKLSDDLGPLRFIIAGQVCLVLAALAQAFFAATTPYLFVLVGLGLFGLGWGLQQSTMVTAATSTLPADAAGLAVGALYTFWNLGGVVGLALAGLLFEGVDRASLNAALAQESLVLSPADQELVRSLLSDPSQARATLGRLSPGREAEILPIFERAFMAGYSAAMWFLFAVSTAGAILVPLIARRRRPGAVAPQYR